MAGRLKAVAKAETPQTEPKKRKRAPISRGERNARWIEKHCRIPEGKFVGRAVKLRPFQRRVMTGIYDSPTRTAIISFGRKNAKTTLAAFLVLLHLAGPEAIPNSQLYSGAQSRDQASILQKLAAKCVRLSPTLSPFVSIGDTAKTLSCAELGTTYRALSADVSTNLGLSIPFVIHDELGQVRGPTSELFDALETAAGAYEAPLSIIISTQAPSDSDLLSVLIDDALRGEDPETKLFLWTADEKLDPFSEAAQRAANPAFGDFLSETEVKRQAAKAKRMPSREASYRNLILNQRRSQVSPFIPRQVWADGAGEIDLELFASGAEVYLALDLSSRSDLTAIGAVVQDPRDEAWHAKAEFFAPLDGIEDRSHRDRAPYDVWAKAGYLTATPGASVDYDLVAERLCEICDEWNVVAIAFDRWRIDVIRAALKRLERELPLVEFGQGFRDMSPALEALESDLANKKLRHGAHPILTWCAANAIAVKDPAGNRKLDKSKSTGRIDGLQAIAMARGAAARAAKGETKSGPSVYDEQDVRSV